MKLLKNKFGFTLIEIMTTLGIMSVIVLVIMNAQKQAINSTGDLKKNNDINELIQLLTAELSKVDICSKNFGVGVGNIIPISPGATPGYAITSIKNKAGTAIISSGDKLGTGADYISIDGIYLTSAVAVPNKISVNIKYTPHTPKVGAQEIFSINLNVFALTSNTTKIESCFSDIQTALDDAVKWSCQGNGARWLDKTVAPPYGTCEHSVILRDSANTTVGGPGPGAFNCPAGELLQAVVDPTAAPSTTNKRILKCGKFQIVGAPCSAWSYMDGVNSADGTARCLPLLGLFGGNGIITTEGTPPTYKIVNITCGAGLILRSVGANFAAPFSCVDPNLTSNCPAGQVAYGTDASGNVLCQNYTNQNACAAGQYATAIDGVGNVSCGSPTLSGSCPSPQVVNGTTAGGAVTCTTMPN